MESLREVTGIAAPLIRANVDTDQIIPTRYLARLSEDGLGEGLFAEWARRTDGSLDPDFVLNQAPWNEATILVAGPMFGCGSSREAAPRALRQRGFRAVVAPSFGDTFFNNCFRNGLAPVRLPIDAIEAIGRALQLAQGDPARCRMHVDVDRSQLTDCEGVRHAFVMPALLRRMLVDGLDEVALTRARQADIDAYRARSRPLLPWAYLRGPGSKTNRDPT